MKKLTILTITLVSVIVNAQSYGIKAGVNVASVLNFDVQRPVSSVPRAVFGVFFRKTISDKLDIQPELLLTYQGFNQNFMSSPNDPNPAIIDKFRYASINLPISFGYHLNDKFRMELGVEPMFISGKVKYYSTSYGSQSELDLTDLFKKFQMNGLAGLSYKFSGDAEIGIRHIFGLSDYLENKPNANNQFRRTSNFQVTAMIPIKTIISLKKDNDR